MPQRFLRPGITNSERWNACTFPAQSLYVRLLTLVDDFGRYDGRPAVIHAHAFALRPDIKLQQVAVMLQQLAASNLIDLYEIDGKKVLQILQWQERVREGCRPKWPERTEVAASCSNLQQVAASLVLTPSPASNAKRPTPSDAPNGAVPVFDLFWSNYPNKQAKPVAFRAWKKIDAIEHPDIMRGLDAWKHSDSWTKDNGNYIPHPATFLNQRRWEDPPKSKAPKPKVVYGVPLPPKNEMPDADFKKVSDIAKREMEKLKAKLQK